MKWQRRLIALIIIISFGISALAHDGLPETMASHWNAAGEVDGYSPKSPGAVMMPMVMAFIALLYAAIPRIDPLRKNIRKFQPYYENFFLVLILFFFVLHAQILLWNLGTQVSPNITMPVLLGGLFFYIGIVTENTKRNWFIGIRTPWTLSSDRVWDRTHKLGGKLFKAAGLIALLGILFHEHALWFILAPVLIAALYLVIYSYLEYRRSA
jgi:uncharacterized membrane protein